MKSLYKNIPIPATGGKEIIAGNPLFNWTDPDFKNWGLDKEEDKKAATKFEVFEVDKNATYKELFTEPEKQWMTQSQMIAFIKGNEDKLRQGGYTNLFLLKKDEQFFVASVYVHSDGLDVDVARFGDGRMWDADSRHRVVVPQLDSQILEISPLETLTLDQAIAICKESGLTITY